MWKSKHSIMLSKSLIGIFAILVIVIMVLDNRFVDILVENIPSIMTTNQTYLTITIYLGGVIVLVIFYCLYRLLHNLSYQKVFVPANIVWLRYISWLCMLGGVIAIISAIYWIYWLIIAVMAFFIGLIVRVVKNIMTEAIQLKSENDFTI